MRGNEGPRPTSERERTILFLATLGTLMVAVDSTIVILALPTIGLDLSASLGLVIWTILIYLLVTAVLTTQLGRLGDLFGRGRIYLVGFAVFTAGSAIAGFSGSADELIAARAIQAIGGALMIANASALIADTIPRERRGRAFGFTAMGWSIGAVLGILLGGLITTEIGWRYVFFINVPIGIAAIVIGLRSLPRDEARPGQWDPPGFATLSAVLGLVCYGAIDFSSYGLDATNAALIVLGVALLPVFVWLELRAAHPLVDLRELRERVLGFSLLAAFFQSVGYLSIVFLLTMYLQGIRGLSPLNASILLIPGYLVGAVVGPFMGRQSDRLGARRLATAGIGCMIVGTVAYSLLTAGSSLLWVPAISVVTGIGSGTFFPANNSAIMGRATPRTFGAIAGLRATLQNVGTLFSFVLALTIASVSVPRYVAYEVFLGSSDLTGGVSRSFLHGIDVALYGSTAVLLLAIFLSWARGEDGSPSAPGSRSGA
ncbi:MAG: MFS transporter [Thermoplasmata archaeon]